MSELSKPFLEFLRKALIREEQKLEGVAPHLEEYQQGRVDAIEELVTCLAKDTTKG